MATKRTTTRKTGARKTAPKKRTTRKTTARKTAPKKRTTNNAKKVEITIKAI